MNRKERRLAARLGVPFVALGGGWLEVCLGGPGCGCGDAGEPTGAPLAGPGAAPRPAPDRGNPAESRGLHRQPEG